MRCLTPRSHLALVALVWLAAAGTGRTFEASAPRYRPVDVPVRMDPGPAERSPYDVIARAHCRHTRSGEERTQLLFYDGQGGWVLRFTGTTAGEWEVRIESEHGRFTPDQGLIRVTDPADGPGFVGAVGSHWVRSDGQVCAPQYAMFYDPQALFENPGLAEAEINRLITVHGFTGVHTCVNCRWFDLETLSSADIESDSPTPDLRTFEALEHLIRVTYRAGGVVHIWAWGDEQRRQTPVRWGLNGDVDRRLQRYICARLAPLPGWTMGYGFDLQEWVGDEGLRTWRNYMHEHMAWPHMLGGRAPGMTQICDALDYRSYQQHRPDYALYARAIEEIGDGKPVFFEDRFRVRDLAIARDKDYDPDRTRRGLWHSMLVGGVANIWGHLHNSPAATMSGGFLNGVSGDYPNRDEIQTWSRFWDRRLRLGVHRANDLTDGWCLVVPDHSYVFYREGSDTIRLDLSGLPGLATVNAVDACDAWRDRPLGTVTPGNYRFHAPAVSDWALDVKLVEPEPVTSLETDGTEILLNGRPVFLIGQADANLTGERSVDEVATIVDAMMTPHGMNLFAGALGIIPWGAWNNRVNRERGLVDELHQYRYPWLRTGPDETLFGGPRFDLDRFDPGYFEYVRDVALALNNRGIVPVIGAFSEHAIDHPLHWRGHPFHPANNLNALGLPQDRAIPEFFSSDQALRLQEAYLRELLSSLADAVYVLAPFGEMKRAPDAYVHRMLDVVEAMEARLERGIPVCLSGSSRILDRFARHPAVDMIDIYCYHDGAYDDPSVNVPDGPRGLTQTVTVALRSYGKPVVKLYHKYGYPYADPTSPWADPETGTDGGGPPEAAAQAMRAIAAAGGSGLLLKMTWTRHRGVPMEPDSWSRDIAAFVTERRNARLPGNRDGRGSLAAVGPTVDR